MLLIWYTLEQCNSSSRKDKGNWRRYQDTIYWNIKRSSSNTKTHHWFCYFSQTRSSDAVVSSYYYWWHISRQTGTGQRPKDNRLLEQAVSRHAIALRILASEETKRWYQVSYSFFNATHGIHFNLLWQKYYILCISIHFNRVPF